MEKPGPSSPEPISNPPTSTTADDVLRGQLQQLIQHNATAPSVEVHSHINSNPPSRYSSPTPTSQQRREPLQQQQHQMAMPIYDHPTSYNSGYQQQNYQIEPSPYPQLPDTGSSLTPHNAYSTPASSPPTPLQTDGIRTRSGRAINRTREGTPMMSSRGLKRGSPMSGGEGAGAKKKKKTKGQDDPPVELSAPLSELVRDITTVQDTNIEEYVNRGADVRQKEVRESKDGKVKRPMNAFMLYRKSYQNRAKEWRKHDNHQVISRICGVSWAMEPRSLKDKFDAYSKIERTNHGIAFPDYKFAPAKAKNKKGVRASTTAPDSEDEGSDLENYSWDTAPPSRSSSRPIYDPDADYRPPGMRQAYGYHSPVMHHQRLPHPSSFHHSNPGKPRPAEYGTGLAPNQYYQQASEYMRPMYPNHISAYPDPRMVPAMPPYVENVYMNKANSPVGSYHSSPVDQYGNMMGSAYPPPPHPHPRMSDHPIDPSLMGQQSNEHFEPLGIMAMGAQADGLPHYTLDQGGLGGHVNDDSHHQPQYDQTSFHNPSHHPIPDERPTWHDDLPKMTDDWETLVPDPEFNFDNILGTESPSGS
ncbi:hypothetical protein F5Y11DRAFT_217832 [Daldinia sp. FL1419]|nr:hypothetical protein F5Y11DRAFT_217832 [Daldinia sp. FL1419]